MLRWSSWSAAAFAVFFQLAAVSPIRADAAAQSQAASPAARAAFEQGRDAYDRGRFGEALGQFERAYALSPHPKLLYNIGRSADSDGQVERAVSAYSSYLAEYPAAENREFVEARLAKLRALERLRAQTRELGSDTAASGAVQRGAAASVPIDTASAATLPPGPTAPVRDDSKPVWKRPWLWVAIGAVVAGTITASVLIARDDGPERARADVRVSTLGAW